MDSDSLNSGRVGLAQVVTNGCNGAEAKGKGGAPRGSRGVLVVRVFVSRGAVPWSGLTDSDIHSALVWRHKPK